MQKSDTIALTGATGFIGAALARQLAAAGRKIQALIRPASTHKRPVGVAVRWINGDLDDMESLRRLVEGVDAVIHCAGAVRGASREQFNRVNSDGVALAVAEALKAVKLIFITTADGLLCQGKLIRQMIVGELEALLEKNKCDIV